MAMATEKILIDHAQSGPVQKRTNYRWVLAAFAMLLTFMSFMDRVNLSVATPSIIKELHFTMVQIGMLQTVFFVCYACFMIPSGMATEYFGHRRLIPFALAWWSVFTSITPFSGRFTNWIVVRSLFGMGESPVFPGINYAFSNWFPKKERGKASGFLVTGSCLGQLVGMPLSVLIMVTWGWRLVFVAFGILGLVIALAYYVLLRTHPHESKFVNAAELEYITDGRTVEVMAKKMAPWKDFLKSRQFWAIIGPSAAANYINHVFISWLPVYLLSARHFSLKHMGLASAFVFAGPAIGGMTCGFIADYMIGKRLATAKCRAWLGGMGLLLCCGGLYMVATSTSQWVTVMWLTLSLCLMGFSFNSQWAACMDIGGRFAGTVSGWMSFGGNLIGGGLGPLITAWIATRYSWQVAILVTAAVGILGAVSWMFVKPHVALKNAT
jgi:ACS family glucarate transporter-like MFS transporter